MYLILLYFTHLCLSFLFRCLGHTPPAQRLLIMDRALPRFSRRRPSAKSAREAQHPPQLED